MIICIFITIYLQVILHHLTCKNLTTVYFYFPFLAFVFVLSLLLLSRFSRVQLCATPETAAHQAPPSLGFSRQEHWSGLPFPSPMHESENESEVAQSCPTPSDPMDCSLPGSSIHGIFQARVLEWGAIAFSLCGHYIWYICIFTYIYIHIFIYTYIFAYFLKLIIHCLLFLTESTILLEDLNNL